MILDLFYLFKTHTEQNIKFMYNNSYYSPSTSNNKEVIKGKLTLIA